MLSVYRFLARFWTLLGAKRDAQGSPKSTKNDSKKLSKIHHFLDIEKMASWGPPGASWGPWGLRGGLLGPPGRLLGPSWRRSIKEGGALNYVPPSRASKIASWTPLGALLERSWPLCGHPCWQGWLDPRPRPGNNLKRLDAGALGLGPWEQSRTYPNFNLHPYPLFKL